MSQSTRNRLTKETNTSVELLVELVRNRSITPDDAGCQSLIAARLGAIGFQCEPMTFNDVTNLWARKGTGSPLFCFAGHTDVVPPGDESEWHSDPFDPVISDGKLYGRGTADMKGGLAAMITATEKFTATHPEHTGSIAFLITSDEEGPAIDGTRKVVECLETRAEKIDFALVGEPSSSRRLGDVIRIGRRGSLNGKIKIMGVQGHVAYPQLADNPIHRFAPVLATLHETAWDKGNAHFPATSFQVVDIRAGVGAVNVTPPVLVAEFNFRYSTEWNHESLQEKFVEVIKPFDLDYELEWTLSGEPFLTPAGELTDAVVAAISDVAGTAPELSTGGGTSDGRFIAPTGAQVVEFGLLNSTIHQANEFVDMDDVIRLSQIYVQILERILAR